MKLSSISLIAATLSAIASGAIATPGPLHARALKQVNSFKREVDGEPVDLFKRLAPARHQIDHTVTAKFNFLSGRANHAAAREAHITSQGPTKVHTQQHWQEMSQLHTKIAISNERKTLEHRVAAGSRVKLPLHENVHEDQERARANYWAAFSTSNRAKYDRAGYSPTLPSIPELGT